MKYVASGKIIPLLHQEITNEYNDVLSRAKFKFPQDQVKRYLDLFYNHGIFVEPAKVDTKFQDPSDKIFYEVLLQKQRHEEAYLITGNKKHFPHKFFIVTPRQMLDIIMQDLYSEANKL